MGERKTTTLVLLGKTGNGKSSTANSIVGRSEFFAKFSGKSVTKECKLSTTVLKDGRKLNVVDTPGLFDTDADQKLIAKEIARCIELTKDGLHGVLLVTSVRNRFTEEEAAVFDCLQILFGPKISNYIVFAFTGGDELENNDMTLEQFLEESPDTLKNLLHRCNDRKVLFNNKTKSATRKTEQVTELLKQIDSVVAENGGQPYSNELFLKYQAMTGTWSSRAQRNEEQSQIVATINNKLEIALAQFEKQIASEQDARRKAEDRIKELEDDMRRKAKDGIKAEDDRVKKLEEMIIALQRQIDEMKNKPTVCPPTQVCGLPGPPGPPGNVTVCTTPWCTIS